MPNGIERRRFLAATLATGVALPALIALGLVPPGLVPMAHAEDDLSAGEFISGLGQRAVSALTGGELSREEREARFRELLDTHFDVPAIGKFVLGRYWRTASDEEKQEFLRLFEELLVRSYARRFAEYSGESFQVRDVRDEGDGYALVHSLVVRPNAEDVRVDWRVRAENDRFRIVDVIVEGLSMAITQRDEFASVIHSKGGKVAGLIDVLRQKVGQNS